MIFFFAFFSSIFYYFASQSCFLMYLSLRHFNIFLLFSEVNTWESFSRMFFAYKQLFNSVFLIFFSYFCLLLNHFSILVFSFKYSSFPILLANNVSVRSSSSFSFRNCRDSSLPFNPSSIFWILIILKDSCPDVWEWTKVKDSSSYYVLSCSAINIYLLSLLTYFEEYLFVKEPS